MAEQLVPDEVWAAIQPLLPPKPPHPKGGRPWIEDRAVLGGIIYVLRAGVPWRLLPARELSCGSGVTCWRRLRDWQAAGVWEALHHRLLDWLGDDGQVDWSRAAIDSVSVRARRGGADRRESGRPGQGWLQVPPAHRRQRPAPGRRAVGGQQPRLPTARAAGRRRPSDHRATRPTWATTPATGQAARRQRLRLPDLPPAAPPPRDLPADRPPWVESSTRLGRHRWKVERSLAWLLANRRLTVRYERRADILTAFPHLACALLCARKLRLW
jgi:transposase